MIKSQGFSFCHIQPQLKFSHLNKIVSMKVKIISVSIIHRHIYLDTFNVHIVYYTHLCGIFIQFGNVRSLPYCLPIIIIIIIIDAHADRSIGWFKLRTDSNTKNRFHQINDIFERNRCKGQLITHFA